MLGASKIIENMELGHNVMHGQWDWMNDPEIHSSSWEWDIVGASQHWKQTHNHIHHKYTNVVGMDDDVGYGLLRVTRDQRWNPLNIGNPVVTETLSLARNGLAAVAANSSENSSSSLRSTLRRSGVGACARWRVVIRPNLCSSRRRLTRAAFSNPVR